MNVLEIKDLTKRYGRLVAVNNLSLAVEQGQIFGILGPNGSGKTTTLGTVLGITNADSGSFRWFEGTKGEGAAALQNVGALLETPNFYPYMTAEQNLAVVAHIKHTNSREFERILTLVNLWHRRTTPFSAYSLGMKQRLAIAATMVGDPDVLIFDEPTNGLDPVGIAEVRETILHIAKQGKTIFMASHILDEVEKICSHVAIIKNGNLLMQGEVGGIMNAEKTIELSAQNMDILRGGLSEANFVSKLDIKHNLLIINLKSGYSIFDVSKFAFEKGIILTHLAEKKHRLEETFLEITKN